MSYTIQPTIETKRSSLYTCIRYAASNLVKFKTKHNSRNKTMQIPNYEKPMNHYCYDEEETVTLYDEKQQDITTHCYHSRRESQLALPSRLKYTPINLLHQFDNNEDEEEEESIEDEYEEDEENDLDNYILQDQDSYPSALQKLSGISFQSRTKKSSTAVLITLSPCALAAANAARQKRQKIRLGH